MANGQATDDFNRADANPISGDWAQNGTLNLCQIVDQKTRAANVSGGGDHALYAKVINKQQTSTVDVITLNSGGQARAVCRGLTSVTSSYFIIVAGPFGASVPASLAKNVAGAFSVIGSGSSGSLAANGNIACDTNATDTVRGLINGSQIYSVTDTSIAGGYMGIGFFCDTAVTQVELDNWQGDYVFDQDAPTTAVSIGACSIVGMT